MCWGNHIWSRSDKLSILYCCAPLYASINSFAWGAHGGFSLYLNLHIAEQRPIVQQLVILPAPANLPHIALFGQRRGGVWCSSPQVTEVTCSLRWWGAHTDVPGEIIWSRPVVSNSIWALLESVDMRKNEKNNKLYMDPDEAESFSVWSIVSATEISWAELNDN